MKIRTLFAAVLAFSLVFTALGAAPTPALAGVLADDEPPEVEFIGTVTQVEAATRTLIVEVENEDETITKYLVYVPEDFDFDAVMVGDVVEVDGVFDKAGDVIAKKVKVETEADEDEGEDQDEDEMEEPAATNKENYFCTNPDVMHPVGQGIAAKYEELTTYEEVMGWFCEDSLGFGQIMLGLQTALVAEIEPSELLGRRLDGEGWGVIWQDLDLVGRSRQDGPAAGFGKPEDPGKPEDAGKPDEAGKPEGAGKPDEAGKPDDAGKPEGAGKPADVGRPEGKGKPPKGGRP
jgi:hypothetical protein